MAAHALLSPSGAHRWIECPASLAMEYLFEQVNGPSLGGSDASRLGTAAHTLGEMVLNQQKTSDITLPVSDYLGQKIVVKEGGKDYTFEVDQEMVDAVERYIEYINGFPYDKIFIEQKVDFSHIVKDGSGFSDCIFTCVEKIDGKPCPTLYVVDYKHGFGYVNAWENPQGKLYALGALKTLAGKIRGGIERVVIVIVQPRIDNISEFVTTVAELKTWGEKVVKEKAKLAFSLYNSAKNGSPLTDSDGHIDSNIKREYFSPSDSVCKWCKSNGVCKERAITLCEGILDGFEDLTSEEQKDIAAFVPVFNLKSFKNTALLSNADISALLKIESGANSFFKDLKDHALKKAMRGEEIPDFKPIRTLKNTDWKEGEEETLKVLSRYIDKHLCLTDPALKSPGQIKTVMAKVKVKNVKGIFDRFEKDGITYRALGEEALVPMSNKRPSIAPQKKEAEDTLSSGFLNLTDLPLDSLHPDFLNAMPDIDFLNLSKPEKSDKADTLDLSFLGL